MKLKKPLITILLLIILVLLSLVSSFLLFVSSFRKESNINKIIDNYDLLLFIKGNEEFNSKLNEKKINIDIINDIDIIKIKNEMIYGIQNNKDFDCDLESELVNSINMYEKEHCVDIYNYVKSDVNKLSYDVKNDINNSNTYNFMRFVCSIDINTLMVLVLSVSIICILIFIIIIEKQKGLLLNGIVLFIYSLLLFGSSKVIFSLVLNNSFFVKEIIINIIDELFIPSYGIFLLIGVILLIVYVFMLLIKLVKRLRTMYYDNLFGG